MLHPVACDRGCFPVSCRHWLLSVTVPEGLTGKPVRDRRGPATVTGEPPPRSTGLALGRGKGRLNREPGDLPLPDMPDVLFDGKGWHAPSLRAMILVTGGARS